MKAKKKHERLSEIEQMKGRQIKSVSKTREYGDDSEVLTIKFIDGSFIEFYSGRVTGYLGHDVHCVISVIE